MPGSGDIITEQGQEVQGETSGEVMRPLLDSQDFGASGSPGGGGGQAEPQGLREEQNETSPNN